MTDTQGWTAGDFTRVPYTVYQDPEVYRQEQEQIFRGPVWCYLALEAELPNPGDYKSTFVGDTPVVVTRGADQGLYAWVNRCAHKGALVCRSPRGNVADGAFTCVYHQWAYTSQGDLAAVPFRRGMNGVGGLDRDFDMKKNGLRKLRVETINGMVFGTFSDVAGDLREFLGANQCANIERIIDRPIKVLGYARQLMGGELEVLFREQPGQLSRRAVTFVLSHLRDLPPESGKQRVYERAGVSQHL